MNILENLYVAESASDLIMLKFGLFISLAFAIPYLTLLVGSAVFSVIHFNKAKVSKSDEFLNYSKFLAALPTKIWFRIIFGVLPVFGSVFFFTQLYAEKIPGASGNLFLGFILFILGLCSIVFYKVTFKSKDLGELSNLFSTKIAWLGITLVTIAAYIFVTYFQVPLKMANLGFLEILFAPSSILYLLLFIGLAFGLTSAVVVAILNRSSVKSYTEYGRKFAAQSGMIFSFLNPLLLVLLVFNVPKTGLSFIYFGSVALVLLLMLVTAIQFYYSYKENDARTTSIVFVFVLMISIIIFSVQATSETEMKKEIVQKGEVEVFD